jgi:hypothetical protein
MERLRLFSIQHLAFSLFFGLISFPCRGQVLDALVSRTDLWQLPRGDFVDQHRDIGFYWLSNTEDRAETHAKGLTLFSMPVYEVDADFQGDKLSGLTISIYNRGDAGDLEFEQWKTLLTKTVEGLTAMTKVQPVVQDQEASDAVKAYAMTWQTPASQYLLEYSRTREVKSRNIPFRAEFVRLRVTPAEKPKSFMAAALESAAPQAAFDGPSHVKKETNGDVRIETVPMVDQGEKGYCVVATAERVMRYYGVSVDEHELAELANSSATAGTSNAAMFDSLKKLSQRLRVRIRPIEGMDVRQILDLINEYNRIARRKRDPEIPDQGVELDMQQIYRAMKPELLKEARTHNQSEVGRFQQEVQDHIDQGIPVLWSVMLGIVPEPGLSPQAFGGHMRLIIGYNSETNEILYSDPWGPGHELERMPADDAWTITTALDSIEPLDASE